MAIFRGSISRASSRSALDRRPGACMSLFDAKRDAFEKTIWWPI